MGRPAQEAGGSGTLGRRIGHSPPGTQWNTSCRRTGAGPFAWLVRLAGRGAAEMILRTPRSETRERRHGEGPQDTGGRGVPYGRAQDRRTSFKNMRPSAGQNAPNHKIAAGAPPRERTTNTKNMRVPSPTRPRSYTSVRPYSTPRLYAPRLPPGWHKIPRYGPRLPPACLQVVTSQLRTALRGLPRIPPTARIVQPPMIVCLLAFSLPIGS